MTTMIKLTGINKIYRTEELITLTRRWVRK